MTQEVKTIGIVETKYFSFAKESHPFVLECGEKISPVVVTYETYGELNKDKSNAILVLHALSGDSHAAGYYKGDKNPGWWDVMIGPGKAFDTEKYFIICANVLGGCRGTTGPSSINPKTDKSYGISFPLVTIKDMVNVQKHLIDYLEIEKLLCVAGGSMGGMQVLQWLVTYPHMVKSAIPIATTVKHSPQQIAFNEVGRQAIMADPNWNNGNYYGGTPPIKGLSIARMVGHITYMSELSMIEKFGRRFKDEKDSFKFTPEFEVEGYLQYKGDSFVKRFDANSYLYITKAIDYFNIANGEHLNKVLKNVKSKLLVISFTSDWLYPPHQSREIVKECKLCGIDVTYCEIKSTYGHDAFLIEHKEEAHLIKHFLKGLS